MGTLNSDKLLARKKKGKRFPPGGGGKSAGVGRGKDSFFERWEREYTREGETESEREKLSRRERDRETELCVSAEHERAFLCSPAGPLGKAAKALRENSCMQ